MGVGSSGTVRGATGAVFVEAALAGAGESQDACSWPVACGSKAAVMITSRNTVKRRLILRSTNISLRYTTPIN